MSVLPKYAVRVLHCPTNIAGQMWEYVQGLRSLDIEVTGSAPQGAQTLGRIEIDGPV
jgi:hypothetical protein